jgi:hypothetical protein
MLGGTEDQWLIPLDPKGNVDLSSEGIFENILGCHVGDFIGLNIANPLPGYEYQWMLNPNRRGAGMGDALAISRLQGHILTADDPEFAVLKQIEGGDKSFLDTCSSFRELVPVRIPEEVIRQKREQEAEANLRMLKGGPAEDFVSRAHPLEHQMYGNKGPTRFRQSTHQTEFDEGGRTKELHQPDSGIVKVDDNR